MDQGLGNLHGIECGAFEQIIGYDPHRQAVLDRAVLANPRNEGREFASGLNRRDVTAGLTLIDDLDARRGA